MTEDRRAIDAPFPPPPSRSPVIFRVGGISIRRPVLLAGIFLIALLLRAAYLFAYARSPLWDILYLDTHLHDLLARRIADQGSTGHHPFFRAPLYPYLLGFLYSLFGPGLLVPRLVNILCGALSCVLVYLVGERVFRPAVGLTAALAAAGYWVFIYFEGELLLVAIYVCLLLLFLHLLLGSGCARRRTLLAAGIVLGLATITRPNVLIFYPFLLAGFLLHRAHPPRTRLARAALCLLPALAVVGAVTVRNYLEGGDRVLVAYQAGVNFYIGNRPGARGNAAEPPYDVAKIPSSYRWRHRDNVWINDDVWLSGYYLAERETGRRLKPSEFQNFWFRKAFTAIWNNKWDWLKLILKKCYFFLNTYEVPSNKDLNRFARRHSVLLRTLSFLDFGWIVSLGLLGLVTGLREWRRTFFLSTFLLSYAATNIAFFINTRYRVPLIPVLMLFAAAFLARLWTWWRSGKRGRAGSAMLACAVLVWFTHTDGWGLKDPGLRAVLHYDQGLALVRKGREEAAVHEFEEAARLNPGVEKPVEALCAALNRLGRYDDAVTWGRKGVDRFPRSPGIRLQLGTAYLRSGRPAEAATELEKAAAADPANGVARLNLGIARWEAGALEKARAAFEAVLFLNVEDPRIPFAAHLHLGFIHEKKGDPARAEKEFLAALNLNPRNRDALLHLARVRLARGEKAAARKTLEKLLRFAPEDEEARTLLEKLR